MDIIDILVTLIILAVVIGGEVVKVKKKLAPVSRQNAVSQDEEEQDLWEEKKGEAPVFQDMEFDQGVFSSKNENFKANSSKSGSYFTYEDVPEVEAETMETMGANPVFASENHLQEIENETETLNMDLDDPEELRKAIIYSEILKNPYN